MNSDSRTLGNSSVVDDEARFLRIPSSPPSHNVARATHRVLTLRTKNPLELINLTGQVQDVVKEMGVREGLVLVSSMHTTLALMVNEWQEALLADIREMLGAVVPSNREYRHNNPRFSDCDRKNAHAHLQATLLGHSLSFGVVGGRLSMGQFQAVIAAELDGPRERQVTVQIFSFN
jgi:secondary thiamine-phosphate synthase enzyme